MKVKAQHDDRRQIRAGKQRGGSEKRQARRDDYRAVGRRRQGRRRRRLNWCNELIDWRCLCDRHRYTPWTRLHVRWLSAQRRPASLSIAGRVRATPYPAYPVRDSPPLFLSPLPSPPPPTCSLAERATSAPNCQRAKYVLHSSCRFSLCTPRVNRPFAIRPSRRLVSSRSLTTKLAAKTHCRLNTPSCNISFFLIAAYISHAWESSRQGESLILLGRSLLREERNTGLASLAERVLAFFQPARSYPAIIDIE